MNLYLVNGFLGSGKTTAIANACRLLTEHNIKVAVITNDQGMHQVDEIFMQQFSPFVSSVSNGCFCCRYNELEEKIMALSAANPEIIFAESVGSCTDIVATIIKPFAKKYNNVKIVLTAFADAALVYSLMKGTSCFIEESVQYIFKKQLEEADIIILNKADLLTPDELAFAKSMFTSTYPGKKLIVQNAMNNEDVSSWLQILAEFPYKAQRQSLSIDYNVYGEGEALLAWLDSTISIHTVQQVAVDIAILLSQKIHEKILAHDLTIGHLKFLLSDDTWNKKISYTTFHQLHAPDVEMYSCKHLNVMINARVQTTATLLQEIISNTIHEVMMENGCRIVVHELRSFTPGFPKPVHRILN